MFIKKFRILLIFLACASSAYAVKNYTLDDLVKMGVQPMSQSERDERIKQHEEKIKKILDERRQQREEKVKKDREEAEKNARAANPKPVQPGDIVTDNAAGKASQGNQKTAANTQGGYETGNENNMILYIMPLDIEKNIGDVFVTWVNVFNEAAITIDEIKIALSYDPSVLNPAKIFDTSIRPMIKGEPVFEVNNASGTIYYAAKFKRPEVIRTEPLLKIIWETKKAVDYSEIDFSFDKKRPTALLSGGKDVLGSHNIKMDGVIAGSLMVVDENAKETRNRKGEYYEGYSDDVNTINIKGKVSLSLKSDKKFFKEGDEVVVDVNLSNPNNVTFDNLNIWMKFDPSKLQVVDWDSGNWIKSGVNVYDALSKRQYPFDFHKRNYVNNENGEIDYRMGISEIKSFPSGTLFKVKFAVKKTASIEDIYFVRAGKTDMPNTTLTCLGHDVLDKKTFTTKNIAESGKY